MLRIITYQLKPYLLLGETPDKYVKPGTEWIRDAVKGLMHRSSSALKERNVDTTLFHNHNETTSKTMPGYPKIIYHYTNGQFLVTGINEGTVALQQLFALYDQTLLISDKLMIRILHFGFEEIEVAASEQFNSYRIRHYLAFNAGAHKVYNGATATGKMELLEKTLHKHLENDLFKYLSIIIPDLHVKLLNILKLDQKLLPYKNHFYLPFDLVFSLNVNLPQFIALGNGKAFGYGIVEKYSKPVKKNKYPV